MRLTRPVLLAFAAIAAGLLGAERAAAQVATEPIRIDFKAHEGCPDEAKFAGEVRARTRKARLASPGEPARFFRVVVARDRGGKSRGKLTIEDPGGAVAAREVTGGSCAEVVSALALISALAIDPKASTSLEPPTTAPAPTVTDVPQLHPPSEAELPFHNPIGPQTLFGPDSDASWPPIARPLPVLPPEPRPPYWQSGWGRMSSEWAGSRRG